MSRRYRTTDSSVIAPTPCWTDPMKRSQPRRTRENGPRPQGRFEVQRFRPNIVVKPVEGEPTFAENSWIGHTLAIGEEVRLNVTGPCGRCVMTTLAQGDLPADRGILRTAVQQNSANVGVYAAVVRGGTIRRGDRVRLSEV